MRMEWGWVEDYPIFVYMNFVTHGVWDIKVVKGVKGDQLKGDNSPHAKAWFKYRGTKLNSRNDVFEDASRKAKEKLKGEKC